MLATGSQCRRDPDDPAPSHSQLLPAEADFYGRYDWCLNPFPTVATAVACLRKEVEQLQLSGSDWRLGEITANVMLLTCAVLNNIEEYLRGPTLRTPRQLARWPIVRGAGLAVETVAAMTRPRTCALARRWQFTVEHALDPLLRSVIAGEPPAGATAARLAAALQEPLPSDLAVEHIGVPSPFRRLDLTGADVVELGRRFIARHPNRSQPLLLLGLRTSGSYFVPLLRALLKCEGYPLVSSLTIQPDKGPGRRERQKLSQCAGQGFIALIIDDSPHTAGTILLALDTCRRLGFGRGKLLALAPGHPARPNWYRSLPDDMAISLEPEQWHKHRMLEPKQVEARLAEYYGQRGAAKVRLAASGRADALNARLQGLSNDERGWRLKRVYEVHVDWPGGATEIRFVLAKSVGWGWLGYHAFLIGQRLSGFVPPILGLRDGILYMEWLQGPSAAGSAAEQRAQRIERAASYTAARVRQLRLATSPASDHRLERYQDGLRLLEKVLSKAYGRLVTDTLSRGRIQRRLLAAPRPVPTLIDGRMASREWVVGCFGLFKGDFEHHGLGKAELNVVDPAFDLADAILALALRPEEEHRLIARYINETQDAGVIERLFLNKLIAGLWSMAQAQDLLFDKGDIAEGQHVLSRQFSEAWNFLTVHAARHCGSYCAPPEELRWRSPIVMLDIDGVIDRRIFGFPSTTPAGIEALSLLNAHGITVALNSARSAEEVREYCDAYGLAGAVAEHGSYLWDAVTRCGRSLVEGEARRQLRELRSALQRLPGVFLDDRHQNSIRSFTYIEGPRDLIGSVVRAARVTSVGKALPAPLPTLVVNHLMASLGLDRICYHQTTIDTTFLARGIDKGTGLVALRDWVLGSDSETIAVGDSAADLPMFRAATRSLAPANIDCAHDARLCGCEIVGPKFQRGLLAIARSLVHADGQRCQCCDRAATKLERADDLFLEVLRAVDERRVKTLLRGLLDTATWRALVR
jgi:hydroxymethylpyrimidine pyrophosphatase-like HAD family hydrolase